MKLKRKASAEIIPDFYLLERRNDIVILRLGKNFLFETINHALKHPLMDVFDSIFENDDIGVLMITNCPEKTGCDDYINFCRHVITTEYDGMTIHRMCNVVGQLILKIFDLNKIVIYVDCGEIISLFLNISLACDYRIIAAHTIFQKPYFKLGLLPIGGGPFFLGNMLGYNKARLLLMSEENISATEAFELGIVDQVVPHNLLEETAIHKAAQLAKMPASSLNGIKRLINYSRKDLKDYLNFESQEIFKTIKAL